MATIIDQTTDQSGRGVYRIFQLYQVPDFVKQAAPERLCAQDDLPSDCYGLPGRLAFPCHTAPATWLSMAYLLSEKQALDAEHQQAVEERLDQAGHYHGIDSSLAQLKAAVAARHQADTVVPSDDSDYALVEGQERHYRLANKHDVKAAASFLARHQADFNFTQRQQMAEKILTKAAAYQAGLEPAQLEYLAKQAGQGLCTAQDVARLLHSRAAALHQLRCDLPAQEKLASLALACLEHTEHARQRDWRLKVAAMVDSIDQEYGTGQIGLPGINDSLFQLSFTKMAAFAATHLSTSSGKTYRRSDVEQLPMGLVRDTLGETFAAAMGNGLHVDGAKAAQALPTLPWDQAELFDDLMKAAGATAAHVTSKPAQRLTDEALQELAALPV